MDPRTKLKLQLEIEKRFLQAQNNVQPFIIPKTVTSKLIVENPRDITQVIGFDPDVLGLQADEDFNDENETMNTRRVRLQRYTDRVQRLALPNLDTRKGQNESTIEYANRMLKLHNQYTSTNIDTFNLENEKSKLSKNLNEIMNNQDANQVLNSIQEVDIKKLNDVWPDFVKNLKERYTRLNLPTFIQFMESYLMNLYRTKGVNQFVPRIIEPQAQTQQTQAQQAQTQQAQTQQAQTQAVAQPQLETKLDEDDSDLDFFYFENGSMYGFKVFGEETYFISMDKPNRKLKITKNVFKKEFRERPIMLEFVKNPGDMIVILTEFFAVARASRIGQTIDNPTTSVHLRNYMDAKPIVGAGLRRKRKNRNIRKKVLLGSIRSGNNNRLIERELKQMRAIK
jgi:hypothetical protein